MKSDTVDIVNPTQANDRLRLASLLRRINKRPVLSVTQERLWLLDRLQPGNPVYNFQTAWRLIGTLDEVALSQALAKVIARHATLRTRFPAHQGQSEPEILPHYHGNLRRHDLRQQDAEKAVADLASELVETRFNLAELPLFHLDLAVLPNDHVLILTMHHLISDLVSLELLMRDLGEFYSALVSSNATKLAPLTWTYQDFARQQRRALSDPAQHSSAPFWRRYLADINNLEWKSDWPRDNADLRAASVSFTISSAQVSQVQAVARAQQVTPFVILLSSFFLLQWRYTGQADQWLGVPMASRERAELEPLIGMFSTPVPVRAQIDHEGSFSGLLQIVKRALLDASAHAELPLAEILKLATPAGGQSPHLRSLFSFLGRSEEPQFTGLQLERKVTNRNISDFDMFLTLIQEGDHWRGLLEYSLGLFSPATGSQLSEHYQLLLDSVLAAPDAPLKELGRNLPTPTPLSIGVAATFTADDLAAPIHQWAKRLNWPMVLTQAPYNQVFQSLLDTDSALQPSNKFNVLLVRPEDWVRYLPAGQDLSSTLTSALDDFIALLGQASQRLALTVVLCPAVPVADKQVQVLYDEARERLTSVCGSIPNLQYLRAEQLLPPITLEHIFDLDADAAGHVPYTQAFFSLLATGLVRETAKRGRAPVKVVALDCDNTLWGGVIGEDGLDGIKVQSPYLALQKKMKELADAGILLCLVSKNESSDVLDVLDQHPDMILGRGDIVDHRINWKPKSQNLRELAAALNLGLDSFVFIDDNPVEIAEVRAGCPEVLSVCLPADTDSFANWVSDLWILTTGSQSQADRQRLASYQQNQAREALRGDSQSMSDFLEKLGLEVNITPAQDLTRIAQLHLRTNQFNNGGERLDEQGLRLALAQGAQLWEVSVQDRFGDYGVVGCLQCHPQNGVLQIDSFLLSCRVLGRGVEHRMLAEAARYAQSLKLESVALVFNELPRNQPFKRFTQQLTGEWQVPGYCISTANALTCQPVAEAPSSAAEPENTETSLAALQQRAQLARRQPALADALAAPREISGFLTWLGLNGGVRRKRQGAVEQKPRGELEESLSMLWCEILQIDQLDRQDNFFDIGGTSLLLVQVNSRLNQQLGSEIPVTDLFQFPTIASLAAHLGRENEQPEHLAQVADRAQLARQQMARRMQSLAGQRRQTR